MQRNFHHLARGIFIQNHKVLLAKAKGYPNTFLPGGHVEFGESAKEALIREIKEELGINVTVGPFLGLVEHSWEHQGNLHCEINQVFEVSSLELIHHSNPVSTESHLEFFWCNESELVERNLQPFPIRNLIKNYLNGIKIVGWESSLLTGKQEKDNMKIHIDLLKEKDAKPLFKFESENRVFFEKNVPSRGDDYYIFENFLKNHRALLKEQEKGISYFYLIRTESDSIVGRINLVDIDSDKRLGNLGYRVGEDFTRKGIANQAVGLLLKESKTYDIDEIHAKTTSLNIPSQKILEKNNFKRTNDPLEVIKSNVQNVSFIHYIWKNGM